MRSSFRLSEGGKITYARIEAEAKGKGLRVETKKFRDEPEKRFVITKE